MKITVIGHLCFDLPGEGQNPEDQIEYGGIFYSLATLANLAGPDDRIYPVFGVGRNDYDGFMERLRIYTNVNPAGIFIMDGPTNQVRVLSQNGTSGRVECSMHIAPPIPFFRIEPFLDTDGVLINMISGFDISVETLDEIRMRTREQGTPIHFDVHSLTMGIDAHNVRFRRPLTDWRRWCFMLQSIQMNETEAAGLTTERYDEPALINQMMPLMVQTLIITQGKKGATLILQEKKKLERHEIAPVQSGSSIDPPGCGDVFGAAFFYAQLNHKDAVAAAESANRIAAWKSTFMGSSLLDSVHDHLDLAGPE